jgi:hypothetical protein
MGPPYFLPGADKFPRSNPETMNRAKPKTAVPGRHQLMHLTKLHMPGGPVISPGLSLQA